MVIKFMKPLKDILVPENVPQKFYHGGNLESMDDFIPQKNGRYEYGPGLYLIDHLETAIKYAKGSRKLYEVEVAPGNNINDSFLDFEAVKKFTEQYVLKDKREEFLQSMLKRSKDNKIPAFMFQNRILNDKLIRPKDTINLRKTLVENGIDYEMVKSPFGWGENMMVLYNMSKIISTKILKKSEVYK